MSARDAPGPDEPLIFAAPRRAAVTAGVIAALTAVLFVLAANRLALSHIQRVDSAWLRLASPPRNPRLGTTGSGPARGPAMSARGADDARRGPVMSARGPTMRAGGQ